MLRAILHKNFRNKRYWVLLLSVVAVMMLSEFEKIKAIFSYDTGYSVLDIVGNMIMFDRSRAIIAGIMGAISGCGFCEAKEDGYEVYCKMRISPLKYAGAWLVANIAIMMISSFIVYLLLFIVLSRLVPMSGIDQSYMLFAPYNEWIRFCPIVYAVLLAFSSGLSFCILSLISMLVVSVFPNRYVAMGIPIIAVEFLYGMGEVLPPWMDFYHVSNAMELFTGIGPIMHLVYTFLYFGTGYFVLALIFVRRIEKR